MIYKNDFEVNLFIQYVDIKHCFSFSCPHWTCVWVCVCVWVGGLVACDNCDSAPSTIVD